VSFGRARNSGPRALYHVLVEYAKSSQLEQH
jgi:hypothetical protein